MIKLKSIAKTTYSGSCFCSFSQQFHHDPLRQGLRLELLIFPLKALKCVFLSLCGCTSVGAFVSGCGYSCVYVRPMLILSVHACVFVCVSCMSVRLASVTVSTCLRLCICSCVSVRLAYDCVSMYVRLLFIGASASVRLRLVSASVCLFV